MLLVLENTYLLQLHGFACNAKCFAVVIFAVFSLLLCFLLTTVFGRTAKNIFAIFLYSVPTTRGSKIIIVSLHTLKKACVKIFPLAIIRDACSTW